MRSKFTYLLILMWPLCLEIVKKLFFPAVNRFQQHSQRWLVGGCWVCRRIIRYRSWRLKRGRNMQPTGEINSVHTARPNSTQLFCRVASSRVGSAALPSRPTGLWLYGTSRDPATTNQNNNSNNYYYLFITPLRQHSKIQAYRTHKHHAR